MPTFRDNLHLGDKDPVIDSDSIADGAITTDKIEDQAVTREKLACESVGACQIIDGEVSLEKLTPDVRGMLHGAADAYSELEAKIDAVATDVDTNTDDIKDIKDDMVKGIQVNGGVTLRPDPLGVVHIAVGGGGGGGSSDDYAALDSRLQGVEGQVYRYGVVDGQPAIVGNKIPELNEKFSAVDSDLLSLTYGLKQVVFLDYKGRSTPAPVEGKYWLDDTAPYLYKGVSEDGTLQWKRQEEINGKLYIYDDVLWRIDNDDAERLRMPTPLDPEDDPSQDDWDDYNEELRKYESYLDKLYLHRETGKLYWIGSNATLSEVKPWAEDLENLPTGGGSGIVYAYISEETPEDTNDSDYWFNPLDGVLYKHGDNGWVNEELTTDTLFIDVYNQSIYLYIADRNTAVEIITWKTYTDTAIQNVLNNAPWTTAISQAVTTLRNEIAAMANTGHRVMIVAFWQEAEPTFTNAAADLLNYNMSHGIYWMKPSTLTLNKGIFDERDPDIYWDTEHPVALSEEVLYIDRTGRKMYVAKNKKRYTTDPDKFELIEVPYLLRQVSINVDTSEASEEYEYNEEGWEFAPRPFSTIPAGYERLVKINIDGEPYNESEPPVLPAGEYGVDYELEDGLGYVGDSKSYDITVTQNEEPELPLEFNMKTGNPGLIDIEGEPEDITAEMVQAYHIPDLYTNAPIGYDPEYPNRQHIWTAAEVGLVEGTTDAIGVHNVSQIKAALADDNCIGFKLDRQYRINVPFAGDSAVTPSSYNLGSYNSTTREYSGGSIKIPRDFIIDGEVDGEAVGGFVSGAHWSGYATGKSNLFYTEHSLVLHKVHTTTNHTSSSPHAAYYVNCVGGIDQLQVVGCVFDDNNGSGRNYIGMYFADAAPHTDWVPVETNRINHIYIEGCSSEGGLITNNGAASRVVKSFRIIGNTITDIKGIGVLFSTDNNRTYAGLMAYMSCPLWLVGNSFEGKNELVRSSSDYYCGALIENSVLYSLHNTFSNFIAGETDVNGSTHNVATYDQYYNGRQLYFANNTSLNIVFMSMIKRNSGYLKAKGNGYIPSDFDGTHLPLIRYFKYNKLLLCPTDVEAIWDERTSSGSDDIDHSEENLTLSEVMTVFIDIYTGGHPLMDFTFSDNEINALWSGTEGVDDLGTGNIMGSMESTRWFATHFTIENNTFHASRLSSVEWGYRSNTGAPYASTWLFPLQLDGFWGTTSLHVSDNEFHVAEDETVNFYVSRYTQASQEVGILPKPSDYVFSDNNITQGSTIRTTTLCINPWGSHVTWESVPGDI